MSDITEEPLKAARAKSLYTPGPWVVRDNQVGHTHTTHLPFCALAQVTGHIKNEANARLIAAAPDMLAALTAIVEFEASPDFTLWEWLGCQ
jgi:hypothetical protein